MMMNGIGKSMRMFSALLALLAVGSTAPSTASNDETEPRKIEITVTDEGYQPSRIELAAGEPVRLAFRNEADMACAATVHSEDLGIPTTQLPKGETTVIEVKPETSGEFTFACGMGMIKGTVVVATR
jgi:plastocyanin domain-containing protein